MLIADDEKLERIVLRRILEKNLPELNVIGEARNGFEAVELAREHEPHIVLMDIKMPGQSGLEAAREINELRPGTKIIILTAFAHFEYAQNALQIGVVKYLLKPVRPQELLNVIQNCIEHINTEENLAIENKRIKKQLAKLWPYIEMSVVYDLINGNIANEEELQQRTSILGINPLPAAVMVIEIGKINSQSNNEFEYHLIRQRIFEVIQDIFADNNSVLTIPVKVNKYVLLIPTVSNTFEGNHYEYCFRKGQTIIEKLQREDMVVAVGIGNYYKDIGMIRQSYLEALAAQRCSTFAGGNEIKSCASCNQKKASKVREFKCQIEAELLEYWYFEDWEKTFRVIDSWWNNIRNSNLGEDLQKACVLELIIALYREAVTGLDGQSLAVLNLSTIRNIIDSNTVDELGLYFHQAVDEIINIIKEWENNTSIYTVRMAQSFIKSNYSEKIALEDVANHVHLSSSYLSRIFSKEVGMPFSRYLAQVRLNQAKKLLLTTTMPVSKIAAEVGYQDTSYFCRTFKEGESLSPNEYRIKHEQELNQIF